jgi:hypothetical protein
MKWLVSALGALALVCTGVVARADEHGPVIRAHDTVIRQRVPKPIAAIEVPRAKPVVALAELQAPFALRIEQGALHDPF